MHREVQLDKDTTKVKTAVGGSAPRPRLALERLMNEATTDFEAEGAHKAKLAEREKERR